MNNSYGHATDLKPPLMLKYVQIRIILQALLYVVCAPTFVCRLCRCRRAREEFLGAVALILREDVVETAANILSEGANSIIWSHNRIHRDMRRST